MRVGVIFPGQGSQSVGMGGGIGRDASVAELFERANAMLGYNILDLIENGPEDRLRETAYSQPAIYLTNYALCAALGSDLAPVASAGHSFGEYWQIDLAT